MFDYYYKISCFDSIKYVTNQHRHTLRHTHTQTHIHNQTQICAHMVHLLNAKKNIYKTFGRH